MSTPLSEWMDKTGASFYAVARGTGISQGTIRQWASGRTIPSLVGALRLSSFTAGKVDVADWLETPLANLEWRRLMDGSKK